MTLQWTSFIQRRKIPAAAWSCCRRRDTKRRDELWCHSWKQEGDDSLVPCKSFSVPFNLYFFIIMIIIILILCFCLIVFPLFRCLCTSSLWLQRPKERNSGNRTITSSQVMLLLLDTIWLNKEKMLRTNLVYRNLFQPQQLGGFSQGSWLSRRNTTAQRKHEVWSAVRRTRV